MTVADYMNRLAANRRNFAEQVEAIRANPQLSPLGRRDALTAAYQKAMEVHRGLRSQVTAAIAEEKGRLVARAFRPHGGGILSSADESAFRLATEQASRAAEGGGKKLRELAERAIGIYDRNGMRAVGLIAYEQGDWQLLSALGMHEPDLGRLVGFEEDHGQLRSLEAKLAGNATLSAPSKPAEVPHYEQASAR